LTSLDLTTGVETSLPEQFGAARRVLL